MPTPSGGGGGAAMQQAPFVNPNAPAPAAQPVSSPKGPLANPAAAAAGNDRFKLLNYDVPGGGRTPYISALNLGGLFGGGGQAPANPANVPSPNAQPVSGPLARRDVTTKAPWGYGPLQKGRSWPQGPDYGDIPVGYHSGYQ